MDKVETYIEFRRIVGGNYNARIPIKINLCKFFIINKIRI